MPTVRINTYDQTTGPQGAALPQANIPGNFQIEANAARQFDILGNALRGLAGVELRMKDAQRADTLNAAKANYMNDIMREQERLGNEDLDYATQRERYVQFQRERRDFYGAQLDQNLRQDFDNSILLPSTQHEFQVGQMAMAGLNDKILANVNQRISDLTSQSGFDRARDDEALGMIEQELATLVNNKVIGQDKARDVLEGATKTMRLNRWSIDTENDPHGVIARLGNAFGGNVPHEFRAVSPQNFHGKIDPVVKAEIIKVSEELGVDPNLSLAVAWQESGGKQGALSGKGAKGIFQLMPGTAQDMKVNPDDWRGNIRGGVQYLSQQLKAFGGNVPLALAAYNAGPRSVQQHGGVPPFKETMQYVPAVMAMAGYERDPSGSEAELIPGAGPQFSPQDMDGLTTQEMLHFYNQAQANIKQEETQRNSLISAEKRNVADHMEYAVMTGDFGPVKETEANLIALGDYETAAALGEQRNIYEQIQPTLQGYSSEPLLVQAKAADDLLMERLRPDNAGMISDMRKNLQTAMGRRVEEFKTDPAGFAAQSAYVNAPNISAEERTTRSLEVQARLGEGLTFTPQVLSKEQAISIRNDYDRAPTADKNKILMTMKSEYGQYFYDAAKEASLPSVAVALGGGLDSLPESTLQRLLSASSTPESEIPKQMEKADAEAQVSSSRVMQGLQATAALLAGDEDQVKAVAQVQSTFTKFVMGGGNLNDIDNQYNTVLDSGFNLVVPKSQGDINDIVYGLDYRRIIAAQDMVVDATNYADMLAARERILSGEETVWIVDGEQFILMDAQTQSIAIDRFGQPIITNMSSIPELSVEGRKLADFATREERRRSRRVF